MATQYAVMHTEKGKGIGGGSGNHIDRTLGMEHTFKHADPKRLHLNIDYSPSASKNLTVPEAVTKRIHQGYKSNRKIRSDSVKFLSTVFTGSHEQMIKLSQDPKELERWVKANADFASEEFGVENIVRFVLHMDEKTPHLHCIHVPLTEDGRLTAKEVLGDRNDLKGRQTRYGLAMKPFGLARGEGKEGVYHEKAEEYYRRINITEKFIDNLDVKGLFGIKTDETLQNTKKALKTALMDIQRAKRSLEQQQIELQTTKKTNAQFKKDTAFYKENLIKANNRLERVAKNPESYKKLKAQFEALDMKKIKGKGKGFTR
jgi:hypothetical protein